MRRDLDVSETASGYILVDVTHDMLQSSTQRVSNFHAEMCGGIPRHDGVFGVTLESH